MGGYMIPLVSIRSRRNKKSPLLFRGLNRKALISDQDIFSGKNISSINLPAITNRKPRELAQTIANCSWLEISTEGKKVTIEGTQFVYDGVPKFTVTIGEKSIVDFNGFMVVFPDKKYYCYDPLNPSFGTNGFFVSPDIDYAVEFGNRVWGVKGNDIYASKLGDFKTWDAFEGLETDSWATSVYGAGVFTDIIKYQNHVVLFKNGFIYEIYGYRPSQFQVQELTANGSVNYKASAEGSGMLLFVSNQTIYLYSGGIPREIGFNLELNVSKARVGSDGTKFYIYLVNNGVHEILVYDPETQSFMPEDNSIIINFAKFNDDVYSLHSNGNLFIHDQGTEVVEFNFVTKEFDNGIHNNQIAKYVNIKVDMEVGSEIVVSSKVNNGAFVRNISIHATKTEKRNIKIPVYVERSQYYQIKIEGKGNVIIYGEREFMIGGDFNV